MVEMVNFMVCIFYHNKKTERLTGLGEESGEFEIEAERERMVRPERRQAARLGRWVKNLKDMGKANSLLWWTSGFRV